MTRGAYGWREPTPDPRDYRFAAAAPYSGPFVDLSSGFPEPPYDQGQLGSCVSNGTAGILDYARAKQGLAPLKRPARLFIYWEGRRISGQPADQDTGLEVRDGLKVVGSTGAPPEDADWPYDIAKFAQRPPAKAYTDAALDVAVKYGQVDQTQIDAAVAAGQPIVFGFTVYESFESQAAADTGVIPIPDRTREQQVGGHCMVIVSTVKVVNGVRSRRVRNSWGTGWGDGGYCWMPCDILDGPDASDFWTLTTVNAPNPPQPPQPPTPPGPGAPFPAAVVVAVQSLLADPAARRWGCWASRRGDTSGSAARGCDLQGQLAVITLADVLACGVAVIVGAAAVTWAMRTRR